MITDGEENVLVQFHWVFVLSGMLLFQVGVHIADVSHFIRPGNALDQEAASRGTTVYLCGKVLICGNVMYGMIMSCNNKIVMH